MAFCCQLQSDSYNIIECAAPCLLVSAETRRSRSRTVIGMIDKNAFNDLGEAERRRGVDSEGGAKRERGRGEEEKEKG